ncbi:MAG: hypothetical protein L6R40_004258 [Gallowayella cf. fulva]|nr:MAG: hypothetical protein L6R40_004258 [Xanthomendoza cf. fulva]
MSPLSSSQDKDSLSSIRVHGNAMASDTFAMESLPSSPPNESSEETAEEKDPIVPAANSPEYLQGWRLAIVMLALLLSMFLVALDMTIVATAIPRITDEFHSLDQVGWYASAFLMTLASFQSSWGKAYKYLPLKWSFLASVLIFELGSLACAVAKNSTTLIAGRAITGVGGAGVLGGVYVIVAYVVSPPKQAAYLGLTGAVFSIASVAGPLLGGILTDRISWRWCFYINLPIGGLALGLFLIFFRTPSFAKPTYATWLEIIKQMDIPGTVVLLASFICYILALQWGGVDKPWSSADVIGCLIGWILLTILFLVIQYYQNDRALLVGRILKQRNVAALSAFIFFLNSANFLLVYNLPIYFQAIDNASPISSGLRNLPLVLTTGICVMIGGGLVGKVGYFQPFLILGAILATIGAGLMYTLDIGSSAGKYIGYQILFGAGLGTAIQIPVIAAQALSHLADIPLVTASILFFQLASGAYAVSAAQSIFNNILIKKLPTLAPGVSAADIILAGSTGIPEAFTKEQVPGILLSYMAGLKAAWAMGIALAGVTFVISFLPQWKSIKGSGAGGGTMA